MWYHVSSSICRERGATTGTNFYYDSGNKINASWFALDTSRGIETATSKLFMRSTVFVSEALIYIPAVLVFCQIIYGGGSNNGYLKKVLLRVYVRS